uniref:OrNV_gp129-like protein n=1 Tax=Nilaparvata lugens endogenous nudivirus TaxID=1487700 RepID=X5GWD1_9VIRU|nr:OrNV_gp129-like protein [Nilaparvata lugens endogenous nudivirus]
MNHIMNESSVILCKREWLLTNYNDSIIYPILEYTKVSKLDDVSGTRLIVGGSWTLFHNTPYYNARVMWFENNLLPYPLCTKYFKVHNGVFVWSRFNLYTKTNLDDPRNVYVFTQPNVCVARIQFKNDRICIDEIDT